MLWVETGINIILVEVGDVHSEILLSFHLPLFQTVSLPVADLRSCSHMSVNILTSVSVFILNRIMFKYMYYINMDVLRLNTYPDY